MPHPFNRIPMKKITLLFTITLILSACNYHTEEDTNKNLSEAPAYTAEEIKAETIRAWNAYKTYAWGYDVLLPLSKQGYNWYEESLGISPFDAFSTLAIMGFDKESQEIVEYALEKNWDQDIYVQVFEVNIRILGGLLAMYDFTQDPRILAKVQDFGDRILPAFDSPTGIPYHSVNLKTGETKGNVINVAQAATYLVEFGILSYYTQDPKYYQAAKKASRAIFDRNSKIGLPGDYINIESGEWTNNWSHLQAGVDSYYEYMLKVYLLFGDEDVKEMWDFSLDKINQYLSQKHNGMQFYACVDMHNGEVTKKSMSLYDAFFPAMQAMAGDLENAEANMASWDWVWDKFGLLPTRYLWEADSVEYANSELNPEIIESAYYLHQITGKEKYINMIYKYWQDLNMCCRNDVAFHAVKNVETMEERDYLATYFYAETLKYFFVAVADKEVFDFNDYIFNTEAHPFKKSHFDPVKTKIYLGL